MTKDQIRAALDDIPLFDEHEIMSWRYLNKHHKTIRTVLQSALDAQDDMVMVPREPTPDMRVAGVKSDDWQTGNERCAHIYRAMIAAAEGK